MTSQQHKVSVFTGYDNDLEILLDRQSLEGAWEVVSTQWLASYPLEQWPPQPVPTIPTSHAPSTWVITWRRPVQ